MATSKKANSKKAEVKTKASAPGAAKKTKPKFVLPVHGDKVSPANDELAANGQPLVFEVESASGNARKNEVVIKPVGNSYNTGEWKLVDRETPVNF